MRADPKLLTGLNRLWIRFFLLAVFATMYVRDHARPVFHAALGHRPDRIRLQGVPHHHRDLPPGVPGEPRPRPPRLRAPGSSGCGAITEGQAGRPARRAASCGKLRNAGLTLAAAATFARLFLLPVKHNAAPAQVRMAPAW